MNVLAVWLVGLGASMVTGVVVYRSTRERHRQRLPEALACELAHHKITCRGEPVARVRLEMRMLLGRIPPIARGPSPRARAHDR